ncbi:MAG: sigma-70 family RNA polymerase sigma factor [Pandoraea sp.]|uniref:sigma-70 family RNA polymerase sigma factor n=1 Tax=Pandoraea sp. TaxID=1883445 RepID=UPI0012286520|nr:sigma-70 family RNA polymerase sigma factor [Pandoraea sp.]TAM13391.1 MAG: sigma-70 family RNA polymerase sigma factor [Pandoraea sp.]TAM54272.1 MAG: sigma-70 family RNA polymerase sigma factor [Paraburkholderia sp.]
MSTSPDACARTAWRRCRSEIQGYLTHRVGDSALAEDILQDIFVKAMQQGEAFCALDNPRAWLFQVARNALVDHIRLHKNAIPLPDDLIEDREEIAPIDALAVCLGRVLAELSEQDREIIQRCDLEGMKLQTFADAYQLSLPGAKSRIQRARQRMRVILTHNCQVRFDEAGRVCCHVPRNSG